MLDQVGYSSLKLDEEEESDRGIALINAVEDLMLVHFSAAHFIQRLQSNDVSYLSEPLCGFKLKQYDARVQRTSEKKFSILIFDENNEELPKLFEEYKSEGSKVLHHLGLLGLILTGQVTGPPAQKVIELRHKDVFRQQDIANDKIGGIVDIPLCPSFAQDYTCQATLSVRGNDNRRMLYAECICNPPRYPRFWDQHQFNPKAHQTNLIPYAQDMSMNSKMILKKECFIQINEGENHNFDCPSIYRDSFSSPKDDILRLRLESVEQSK